MVLLPGQKLINGVSNLIFGSNLGQAINANTVYNTPAIQSQIKAAGLQIMRTSFQPTASHSDMDNHYNAIVACGCVPLITLNLASSLAQNSDLVSYMGSKCNLYEYGNEPDGSAGGGPFTAAQYYALWAAQVPTLRGLNPSAAFIGPTVTRAGIVGGAPGSRGAYISDWLTLCVSNGGGALLPDAVSFHDYPCNGVLTSATCDSRLAGTAGRYIDDYNLVDGLVKGVLGHSLPYCITEWNLPSYSLGASYVTPRVHTILDEMVQAGFAICCQFEAGTGEGNPSGSGTLDLILAISPYPPGLDYQPMVDKIQQYLGQGARFGGRFFAHL